MGRRTSARGVKIWISNACCGRAGLVGYGDDCNSQGHETTIFLGKSSWNRRRSNGDETVREWVYIPAGYGAKIEPRTCNADLTLIQLLTT